MCIMFCILQLWCCHVVVIVGVVKWLQEVVVVVGGEDEVKVVDNGG